MKKRPTGKVIAASAAILAAGSMIAALWAAGLLRFEGANPPSGAILATSGQAQIGEDFELVSLGGKAGVASADEVPATVTPDALRGMASIVIPGGSQPHDPGYAALQKLRTALDSLRARGEWPKAPFRILFIALDGDPEAPARLRQVLGHHADKLLVVGGSDDALAEAAKSFKIFVERKRTPDGSLLIKHTPIMMFMDTNWRYIAHERLVRDADSYASAIRAALGS